MPSETRCESGCDPEDFDGFPAGAIALIQRGSCAFETKEALAAEAADDMIEAVARGNEAMQATLAATNSLADLVEGVEG